MALLEREFCRTLMGVANTRWLVLKLLCRDLFSRSRRFDLRPGWRVAIPAFYLRRRSLGCRFTARLQPVLVEVGEIYRIDMGDFAAKLDDSIEAFIIPHARATPSEWTRIMALCSAPRHSGDRGRGPIRIGTLWHGQRSGGSARSFGFLVPVLQDAFNAGEGGILITDAPPTSWRAASSCRAPSEHNWKKHKGPEGPERPRAGAGLSPLAEPAAALQHAPSEPLGRRDPPAVARAGAARARRACPNPRLRGRAAERLPWLDRAAAACAETAGPDSIQFNLVGFDTDGLRPAPLARPAEARGVKLQIFGLSTDNARAFCELAVHPCERQELPAPPGHADARPCEWRLPRAA